MTHRQAICDIIGQDGTSPIRVAHATLELACIADRLETRIRSLEVLAGLPEVTPEALARQEEWRVEMLALIGPMAMAEQKPDGC